MTDAVRKRATVAPSVRETIAFALRGDATAFQWLVAVFHFFCFSILGLVLTANNAAAQTIGYRQTNLSLEPSERRQQFNAKPGRSLGDCLPVRPAILHC